MKAPITGALLLALLVLAAPAAAAADGPLLRGSGLPRRALLGAQSSKGLIGAALSPLAFGAGVAVGSGARYGGYYPSYYGGNYYNGLNPYAGYYGYYGPYGPYGPYGRR